MSYNCFRTITSVYNQEVCNYHTFFSFQCEDLLTTCQSRPTNLIQIEQTCETDVAQNETLLEKVQENIQTAVDHVKKMVNFAKSKLGFDSSDDPQVQAKKVPLLLFFKLRRNY